MQNWRQIISIRLFNRRQWRRWIKLILLIEPVLLFSQKNPALSKKMPEAYHNEALRKQRIVDKKHAALARMRYAQVLWIVIVQFFFNREFKLYVYGKRQTSDSSWELVKIENEQKKLKTVQKILMDKKLRETGAPAWNYSFMCRNNEQWHEFHPITSSRYYSLREEKTTRSNWMKFRLN